MIQIIWSESAKTDYWQNIEYLKREWTLNEVYNFIDKMDHLLVLLTQNNVEFKSTHYKFGLKLQLPSTLFCFIKSLKIKILNKYVLGIPIKILKNFLCNSEA